MSKTSVITAEKLALYDKIVATNPEIEKKGDAMPYTSLNGHMTSFITDEGSMALRMSEDGRAIFMGKYRAKLCEQHGKVMEEYVLVPDSLFKKTEELKKAYNASIAYVGSLKPVSAAKKKTAARKAAAAKKAAAGLTDPKEITAKKKATKKKAAVKKKVAVKKKAATKKTAAKKKSAK
ncbi:MAG: hypothetical protein ACJASX_003157 [Limisphaerales bacterium]|jgi:hypothetical protein